MANYKVIVTDVTCYGTLYCVAGWDPENEIMVRPEPPGASAAVEASRFWDGQFVGPEKIFHPGNFVSFEAGPPHGDFPLPHSTEDRVVDLSKPVKLLDRFNTPQLVKQVAGSISPNLNAAFNNALVQTPAGKAYVPIGHNGRSLGAVELAPTQISFHENRFDPNRPKLRAHIDIAGVVYDLSVPADTARTRWKADGIDALKSDVESSKLVHARVGLSRPFPAQPNECYSQVNGIYFL